MLRKLLLPPLMSVVLLAGCETEAQRKRDEAVEFTSQARQALRRGEFQEAKIAIDKAITLEPTADRYFVRANTHLEDLPAALSDLNKGLELEPQNSKLLRWKASVEDAMGKKKSPK